MPETKSAIRVKVLAQVMDPEDGGHLVFGIYQHGLLWRWSGGKNVPQGVPQGIEKDLLETPTEFFTEAEAAVDCILFVMEFVKTHDLLAEYHRPAPAR